MDIRAIIAQEIARQELSQYEIARKTGMNQPTLNRYITGQRDMTGERLAVLLDYLGLKITRK